MFKRPFSKDHADHIHLSIINIYTGIQSNEIGKGYLKRQCRWEKRTTFNGHKEKEKMIKKIEKYESV